MPNIALATCAAFPELGPYDRDVLHQLRRRGALAQPAIWDSPDVDWSAFDLVVAHATWDAHLQSERFLAWTRRCAPRLRNTSSLIEWNIHKGYLRDMAEAGIATVPTLWVGRHQSMNIGQEMASREWAMAVVKPAISASAHGTFIFAKDAREAAQRQLTALAQAGDVLIQPYLRCFESRGETSLIYLNGLYSHAVRRPPTLTSAARGFGAPVAWEPTRDERVLADAAVEAIPETSLHLRVDLVESNEGALCVQEVEAIEPCLFTSLCEGASERLADAILAHCE